MRFVVFCHSLVSDWNHGNAHFLRGVVGELLRRGHDIDVHEPADGWSLRNLQADGGEDALTEFERVYSRLRTNFDRPGERDLPALLDGADVVLVHEWNEPELVAAVGRVRAESGFRLFFHDTHHRAATAPREMAKYDLSHYDGVLAFGSVIRDLYLENGWTDNAWTWHEAADIRVFRPRDAEPDGDLVWVGNWGDDERTAELREFLIEPARDLRLRARVYGVRYPEHARQALAAAGIDYGGWLPNSRVPETFARYRFTVHVPRRPYTRALPGIPTIRVFEALACGIPLVSAPWDDAEDLFAPGQDFLVARTGAEMRQRMRDVLHDQGLRRSLIEHGLRAIRDRHTCAHRVDELLAICRQSPSPSGERGGGPDEHSCGVGVGQPSHGGRRPWQAEACCTRTQNGNPHPDPLPEGQGIRRSPLPVRQGARQGLDIAFFGSSLVSAWWNGAATYYRGILRALAARGHRITFYEPDAFERQQHRDIADPDYARVVVYSADGAEGVEAALASAREADVIVKASGVGVFDELLEREALDAGRSGTIRIFWDVDAPATLERIHGDPADPSRSLIPRYDYVFTYGGGPPVVSAYKELGAQECVPIYNAVDPDTHHPASPDARFGGSLGFLANRLPDREARVQEFFFDAAARLPGETFLLGGGGWDRDVPDLGNVRYLGHVGTGDHNAFNCTPRAVLNVCRDSMARVGHSPATRVFEAAGAGACLISDAWEGIEQFLEPGREVLVARSGADVAEHLRSLDAERARRIGAAGRRRVLAEHTYDRRATLVERVLCGRTPARPCGNA